ncbi:MAG: RidA family protein [Chloroflexi bacterium]|nr:RidA family protein [Chloroflexota bacterium]
MDLRTVHSDGAPNAIGPYSQAVVAGDIVFCSGQIPLDPATGELVTGDIAALTARVLDNLEAVLTAAGSSLARVVRTNVYLIDMSDFAAFNTAYAARFGDARPARSTIAVAALPRGARIEIDCIAIRG